MGTTLEMARRLWTRARAAHGDVRDAPFGALRVVVGGVTVERIETRVHPTVQRIETCIHVTVQRIEPRIHVAAHCANVGAQCVDIAFHRGHTVLELPLDPGDIRTEPLDPRLDRPGDLVVS